MIRNLVVGEGPIVLSAEGVRRAIAFTGACRNPNAIQVILDCATLLNELEQMEEVGDLVVALARLLARATDHEDLVPFIACLSSIDGSTTELVTL